MANSPHEKLDPKGLALEEADRLLDWAARFVEDKTYPSDNWYSEYELYRDHTRPSTGVSEAFEMRSFSAENLDRCTSPSGFNHPLESWSLSDWMTATLGELGEAANVLKKLNRVRDGVPGNKETPDELRQMFADEIADSYIYLDLLAQAAGIDLPQAIRSKFDRTSQKIGYLPAAPEGGE